MNVTLDLVATATGELIASLPLAGSAVVNRDRRLIGGLSVPWDVAGQPSMGGASARVIFRAGSVLAPADPGWVKLLIEHDTNRSVGQLQQSASTEAGLIAALRVVATPAGDEALDNVENGTRDALSVRVEVDQWNVQADDTVEVLASRLREVSLVAVPAFEPARATVLASLPTDRREAIMSQLRDMLEITASAPGTSTTQGTTGGSQGQPDGQSTNGAAAPVGPAPVGPAPLPAVQASATGAGLPAGFDVAALAAALGPHLAAQFGQRPGDAPAGPPIPARRPGPTDVRAAASIVTTWQREGRGNVFELQAALNDVVPASDAGGGSGVGNDVTPQWLGELWTARRTGRPYIDSLGTPARLTGLKAKGWRWVTRPIVQDYAGGKAAVPSNAPATEPAEADAHRTAGGWDVDRVFVDLGDASFVEALFSAAAEDYALKSDAWCGDQLLAAAVAEDADGIPAASFLEALGLVAGAAAGVGARVSAVAIAGDVFRDVAGLTKDQVPWWFDGSVSLDLGGQTGQVAFRLFVDPTLGAGEWLAYDRRAATYFEQGSTPIRAQALNIPNGGVDLGVFGYNSFIPNDSRAIFHGTIV